MTLTVATALDRYETERRAVVISLDRLKATAKPLRATIGSSAIRNQEDVAGAVTSYIKSRVTVGIGINTMRRELITLRAALLRLWKSGKLRFRPYVELPPPATGRQRSLTQDEAKRLLHRIDQRIDLFCRLALTTGARLTAILELTWDRVDFAAMTIDFRAPHPKADRRKYRAVVPIPAQLLPLLARERAVARPGDYVIRIRKRLVQKLIREAAKEAGLEGVTAHTLRHTVATWLIGDANTPLVIASRLLGHRSTLITEQVYTHLTAEHLRGASDHLGRMLAS